MAFDSNQKKTHSKTTPQKVVATDWDWSSRFYPQALIWKVDSLFNKRWIAVGCTFEYSLEMKPVKECSWNHNYFDVYLCSRNKQLGILIVDKWL